MQEYFVIGNNWSFEVNDEETGYINKYIKVVSAAIVRQTVIRQHEQLWLCRNCFIL